MPREDLALPAHGIPRRSMRDLLETITHNSIGGADFNGKRSLRGRGRNILDRKDHPGAAIEVLTQPVRLAPMGLAQGRPFQQPVQRRFGDGERIAAPLHQLCDTSRHVAADFDGFNRRAPREQLWQDVMPAATPASEMRTGLEASRAARPRRHGEPAARRADRRARGWRR